MKTIVARTSFILFIACVFVTVWQPVGRALNDDGPGPFVDCRDPGDRDLCIECCCLDNGDCSQCTTQTVTCCPGDPCPVIEPPPETKFAVNVGGEQITYTGGLQVDGKSQRQYFQVVLDMTLKTHTPALNQVSSLGLNVRLTGADAALGGLLYPVAFLAMGPGALDALHAHGYDVAIMGPTPSQMCTPVFSSALCMEFANQLSQALDSALALGDPSSRAAFETGVQALGFASCQAPFVPPPNLIP